MLLWGRGAVQGNASLASAVHSPTYFLRAHLNVDVGPAALCLQVLWCRSACRSTARQAKQFSARSLFPWHKGGGTSAFGEGARAIFTIKSQSSVASYPGCEIHVHSQVGWWSWRYTDESYVNFLAFL